MISTAIKKTVGTVAVSSLALGAVFVSVPGASAMVNNGAKVLSQQKEQVQTQKVGYGQKPNCVNGVHIDRGNNKNNGNGGCAK